MINAFDGERAGAGFAAENFDLDLMAEYLPHHESIEGQFHWWCEKGKNLMLGHLQVSQYSSEPVSRVSRVTGSLANSAH
jgi:hypothetical protein